MVLIPCLSVARAFRYVLIQAYHISPSLPSALERSPSIPHEVAVFTDWHRLDV